MYAARALLRSRLAPPSTVAKPCKSPTSACYQVFVRHTSTSTQDGSQSKTPALDDLLGAEQVGKAKTLSREVGRLSRELDAVYSRQRGLNRVLKGPLTVRRVARAREWGGRVSVRDGRVFVENKALSGEAEREIPKIWLRDNCQCGGCVHETTRQRLLDTFSIPSDISIKSHSLNTNNVLSIEWSDGHTSEFTSQFLTSTVKPDHDKAIIRQGLKNVSLFDASIASSPPRHTYTDERPTAIHTILSKIRQHGFCYIDNTPHSTPTETETLLRRISFIRETHYGAFYDFTADLASQDTAYTNIALEAHTDTTYFSDPAGLQAFHLLSHTEGSGGASLLVDGFKVAADLQVADPQAYHVLATVNVHAHASGNDGISIQPYRGFPVLEHDPATGALLRVRWNTADRAGVEMPIETVGTWYEAARKFDALLKEKRNEYWEQLTPGRVLIFDNWRVLHGRSAFTGKRRICGGYVNRDDWISRFKMGEFGREGVLGALAEG
ncbi:Trimethyllysine dioxygenase [Dothidotthia symphoricarpi CBS 119687]|uniref:Trimethyllysine dioxygenase n=1 Tax=Dothidotthia symphoricarpi CBS 119687 TaxID=1392245 RepID=A0A6A6ANB2_9PLEO|nr:Trimethyllysine dioxygenase [Dothidotthia symphoricarpi CBS 119687]KAF2133419.1 Trimethyllysine dioxygenase [Dothidotthia symphoricarpi CBS 119687]